MGPLPPDRGHTDTWRVCAADVGLGDSQKPHRTEPLAASAVRAARPPALRTSLPQGLPSPLGAPSWDVAAF